MKDWIVKLNNFWFYYKKHLLIGFLAVLAAGYLAIQHVGSPEPDYHIALVQSIPCTEAYLQELEDIFASLGKDVNGDGTVLVQIHTYYADLADESENAGVNNAQTVAALDADLVGGVSSIFLLENAEVFFSIVNQEFTDAVPFGDGLLLTVRADAAEVYHTLANAVN